MTVYELIQSDQQAAALAAAGNDAGCAERCTAIAPRVSSARKFTYLGIASGEGVGPEITRRLIVTIRTVAAQDPLVDEIQIRLRDATIAGGVDVADVGTQGMLDYFAGLNIQSGLTAQDVAAIKALALQPQTITTADVSAAMAPHRVDGKVS